PVVVLAVGPGAVGEVQVSVDVPAPHARMRRPLAERSLIPEARRVADVVIAAETDREPAPPDDLGHAAGDTVGRPHDIRRIHIEIADVDQTGARGPEEPPPRSHIHEPARRRIPQAVDEGERAVADPPGPPSLAEARPKALRGPA